MRALFWATLRRQSLVAERQQCLRRSSIRGVFCSQVTYNSTQCRYNSWIAKMAGIEYPKPRRADVKEELHGRIVEDPYRWMEDPDSEETKAFVSAQNVISKKLIEECPHREQIRKRLTNLWNYPKYTAPSKQGDYYYFRKNDGLQNQYVLYRKQGLDGTPEVFLDPNLLSDDGTVSLSVSTFSENGTYYCYGLSESGSDWSTLYIKDTKTKTDLPEKLERFRYSSVAWTKDEKGLFYAQYPDWTGDKVSGRDAKAATNQKIYYHRLNTPQEEDILVVEFPKEPNWRTRSTVSDCGKYLILSVMEGCKDTIIYVADISQGIQGLLELKCVYGTYDCEINYVANDGDMFYFHTNKDRPNYGIIKLDLAKPDEWTDVVVEDKKNVLEWAHCVNGNKLILAYLKDVANVINVHELESGKFLQTLPFDIGTIGGITGKRKHSEVFFTFVSFLTPGTIYRCEIDKAPNAPLNEYQRIELNGATTDGLSVEQVFYESKDSTKVPMFIIRNKEGPLDSSAPCLLYIYGGFNIPVQPSFSPFRLMLIRALGFTVAVANVRGGGEYGDVWHNSGKLANKQNTMDDVHAAATYLADKGYTSASRITLMGGSNGGMVTAASINQRPELFGAAVALVPVTDMYRFHKFTVGSAWCSDYGNPDKQCDFTVQTSYSPLHNVPRDIDNYPSLLVLTADHDDRVVPSHSLKYIAEVQYRLGEKNKNPLLALIDTKAGHGGGKPTSKVIDELVDIMCFLFKTLSLKYTE